MGWVEYINPNSLLGWQLIVSYYLAVISYCETTQRFMCHKSCRFTKVYIGCNRVNVNKSLYSESIKLLFALYCFYKISVSHTHTLWSITNKLWSGIGLSLNLWIHTNIGIRDTVLKPGRSHFRGMVKLHSTRIICKEIFPPNCPHWIIRRRNCHQRGRRY